MSDGYRIETLQRQSNAYKGQVTTLKARIAELEDRIAELDRLHAIEDDDE